MEKFKISDIQELFAADVERFHSVTQASVSELLTQTPPPAESLDEALRQTHTLKGLAATVEAWGLAGLGADLEKLLELAGSWLQSEPEKARDIFEFILERQQDWFVMNQFTCMDMLPEAWDIYQGLRGNMEERWPGYLPAASPGANGDHQYVRLEDLDLDDASTASAQPLPELDVQDGAPIVPSNGIKPSTPAPLHVVPPVLRQRPADRPNPGVTPADIDDRDALLPAMEHQSSGLDLPSAAPADHQPAAAQAQSAETPVAGVPAIPKPLQVVPPPLKSKVQRLESEVRSQDSAATPAASVAPENLAPVVLPSVAQSVTPPASVASPGQPTNAGHAAPPILRVAPPTLKRRVKKGGATRSTATEHQPGTAKIHGTEGELPPVVALEQQLAGAPVAEVSLAPGESSAVQPMVDPAVVEPTVESLVVAQAAAQIHGAERVVQPGAELQPTQSELASEPVVVESATLVSPLNVPPVVEPTGAEFLAMDQASAGPAEDDTALFAPPPLSPEEAAGHTVAAHLGEAQHPPAVEQDLLELLGQEVAGYLVELAAALAGLAGQLDAAEQWEQTRRLFHTIKGTAATFHLDAISAPAKAAEAHCIVAIEAAQSLGADAVGRAREAFESCVQRAAMIAKGLGLPFNEGPLHQALAVGLARAAMQAAPDAALGRQSHDAGLGVALDPEMAGFFIRDARDQIEVIEQALVRWERGGGRAESGN